MIPVHVLCLTSIKTGCKFDVWIVDLISVPPLIWASVYAHYLVMSRASYIYFPRSLLYTHCLYAYMTTAPMWSACDLTVCVRYVWILVCIHRLRFLFVITLSTWLAISVIHVYQFCVALCLFHWCITYHIINRCISVLLSVHFIDVWPAIALIHVHQFCVALCPFHWCLTCHIIDILLSVQFFYVWPAIPLIYVYQFCVVPCPFLLIHRLSYHWYTYIYKCTILCPFHSPTYLLCMPNCAIEVCVCPW